MIDLEWIASQPKPVAIYCPTFGTALEILTEIDPHRPELRRLGGAEFLKERARQLMDDYDKPCIRISFDKAGFASVGQSDMDFYDWSPDYILVRFEDVLLKTPDLGEIEADASEISCLFGMERYHDRLELDRISAKTGGDPLPHLPRYHDRTL